MNVNPDDPRYLYEQIADQLRMHIRGAPAGKRLPTVRALATEVGAAPNTVQAALNLLKSEGLITTNGQRGTFVAAHDENGGEP